MTSDLPPIPRDVAGVLDGYPPAIRTQLMSLRALIFEMAAETATGPLTETLKWGQPSYLTEQSRAGSTIRLGWSAKDPETLGLFVHCGTDLIDQFRELTGDALHLVDRRAVLFAKDSPFDRDALGLCIGAALTYHRNKRSHAGSSRAGEPRASRTGSGTAHHG